MPKIVFLLLFSLAPAGFVWAQKSDIPPTKVFAVCSFELEERGRAASFRFSFTYILDVGIDGRVRKIQPLATTKKNSELKFVKDALFVECMERWKLEPAGKYMVQFNVGTTSIGTNEDMPFNYMRISGPDKQSLIVDLAISGGGGKK